MERNSSDFSRHSGHDPSCDLVTGERQLTYTMTRITGRMRALVCSEADNASVNIRDRLTELADWKESGEFERQPVLANEDMLLITIQQLHIHAEEIDVQIREELEVDPEVVIFLSRHRAASGIPTLTVHPIGNHRGADFGGRERTLVPASPHLMTSMLRVLKREAADIDFAVSFEVTHHGPYLITPSIFIEIGSDESMWDDREAAKAIARTLLHVEEEKNPVVVGLGGGHYAPRFTEVAVSRKVSMGHMVPTYAMKGAENEELRAIIGRAAEASNASKVYIHKKSMKKSEATSVRMLLTEMGLEVVESRDLEPLL